MKSIVEKNKKRLIKFAEAVHLKLFGHEMSDTMREFLGNLSWSFFGGIFSAGILFIVSIMAGRLLGPEEYGKYGLVVALSAIFIIPMTMGINAAVIYYIAKEKTQQSKNDNLSVSLQIVLLLIPLFSIVIFISRDIVANVFSVDIKLVGIILLFSFFLAFRNLADSFLKGLKLFKIQSSVKIIEAFGIIILFLLTYYIFDKIQLVNFVGVIVAGYILSLIIVFFNLKNRIHLLHFYKEKYKPIIFYGLFASLGAVSGVLLNSLDKILINKYISTKELGLYNAYATVSVLVMSQLAVFFVNVLFPYSSEVDDGYSISRKINKLAAIVFCPGVLLITFIIFIVMFFFGDQYDFNFLLAVEFGILANFIFYFSVLSWFTAAQGRRGVRFTSINSFIAGIILLTLTLLFRDSFNLYLAVLFLIISILYAIIINNIWLNKKNENRLRVRK